VLSNFLNRYDIVLKNLGLPDYEIRVYMTLLKNGPMNYRTLAQESGVPTGRIYQVLSTLESKGFIEVDQEKTKFFKAADPKKALMRRLRQIEEDYFELEHKTRQALQVLQLEYSHKYEDVQGIVSQIRVGSDSFSNIVTDNLIRAEEEILVSSGELIDQLHMGETVKDLLSQGVSIRAIYYESQGEKYDASRDLSSSLAIPGIKTRMLESIPTKYFVVDAQSVLLFLAQHNKDACLQIQGKALCHVFRDSFTEAWEKAGTLSYNDKFNLHLNVQTTKHF